MQQKRQHNTGEQEPFTVHRQPEQQAGQRKRRSVDLQRALDIPLAIECFDALDDRVSIQIAEVADVFLGLLINSVIDRGGCRAANSIRLVTCGKVLMDCGHGSLLMHAHQWGWRGEKMTTGTGARQYNALKFR